MSGPLGTLAELSGEAWLVGGAVRDELLGRRSVDFDITVAGEVRGLARALGRREGAASFELSGEFGAWRVTAADDSWRVDLMPLVGGTLEADLARRDLTINAIARPLTGGRLIDPHGGVADLRHRLLRVVGSRSFLDDPLRVARLVRLACELDFQVEPATARAAVAAAPDLTRVAGERIFAELRRILASDRVLRGLAIGERLGVTAAVLPELLALRGVEQSAYHHLDVHDHTIAALAAAVELERRPESIFGREVGAAVTGFLTEPLADQMTRGTALRLGALMHDIAKQQTRTVTEDGHVRFLGHDVAGAALSRRILGRLRTSERLADHVAALTRHHLRLGFLVHRTPLDGRAEYGYLSGCDPVEVDVTLLSVADRLATQGRNAERAIALHLELARELLPRALAWHARPPRPPIRGDRLAAELELRPGPLLGAALAELTAAAYAGEVDSELAAVAHARRWLEEDGAGGR